MLATTNRMDTAVTNSVPIAATMAHGTRLPASLMLCPTKP